MTRLNLRSLRLPHLLVASLCYVISAASTAEQADFNPWFSPAFYQAKPAYLTDISLSVEQEENLFKLLHAQLPAIRELQSERLQAEQEVQEHALVHNYDRELLEPMIERLAKAVVAENIQRAEIDNRIVSLLTPAQRETVTRWWQLQRGSSTQGATDRAQSAREGDDK